MVVLAALGRPVALEKPKLIPNRAFALSAMRDVSERGRMALADTSLLMAEPAFWAISRALSQTASILWPPRVTPPQLTARQVMAAWQCPRAMAATRALNKEAVDVMANIYIQTRLAVGSTRYLPRDSVRCGVGVTLMLSGTEEELKLYRPASSAPETSFLTGSEKSKETVHVGVTRLS